MIDPTIPDCVPPRPVYRLIPSQFPPIGLFDTVATAADLEAVMELAGWTNDRLVAERLQRIPRRQWVFGKPNSSIVMASFLHAAPTGLRFSGPDLGAWYAAADLRTAAAEVGHHLRREAIARGVEGMTRTYRAYSAALSGNAYLDVRGLQASHGALYRTDTYGEAQDFGETARREGSHGIVYDSVRHRGGCNVVAFVPTRIGKVTQGEHLAISVTSRERGLVVKRLASP